MKNYDLVVLGGGPGGYVAAIKAAQLGAKVAVVEKNELGGVCLNWGCIPTKTLLHSAKLYYDMKSSKEYGIKGLDTSKLEVDWLQLLKRKDNVKNRLISGINMLFKKNKIDLYKGEGEVLDKNNIKINEETLTFKNLIIATGAKEETLDIPGIEKAIEDNLILDSKKALELEEIPKELVILGNGNYAVEFAALFTTIGSKVTIINKTDTLLSGVDKEMTSIIERLLKKNGVKFISNAKVKSINNNGLLIEYKEKEEIIKADKYLVTLGIQPNDKAFKNLGLKYSLRGFIETDEKMETSIKGIYAVGDINGKYPLAHVASAEGIVAAENIMGIDSKINYNHIPMVIYTFPELATVGLTEEKAREKGYDVTVSKFPLSANGKALSENDTLGFIKVISDNQYGEIIGTHIVSNNASDMITSAVAVMQLEGTVYDMAKAILPHPTTSEIYMEAAFGAIDKPIHM